jgi:hypothetical protein
MEQLPSSGFLMGLCDLGGSLDGLNPLWRPDLLCIGSGLGQVPVTGFGALKNLVIPTSSYGIFNWQWGQPYNKLI